MDPQNTLESIKDGVCVAHEDRRIIYWNKGAGLDDDLTFLEIRVAAMRAGRGKGETK